MPFDRLRVLSNFTTIASLKDSTSISGVEISWTALYRQVDLDGNGTLSRTEFNLFNWRTSGEEVQDDEWQVVKDNFSMKNGELTMEGFLQLHQV